MNPLPIDHDDVARRGKFLYEQSIRREVETDENIGKIVVIDPETGAFAVDNKGLDASRRLHALHPGAPLYGIRIGYNAAISFGGVIERTDNT